MSGGKRYPHAEARAIAEGLRAALAPYCDRIAIAGSLRRGRADVGDMEIVVLPRYRQVQVDLFGKTATIDALDEALRAMLDAGVLTLRKNIKGYTAYGAANKLLIHAGSGIPLDVFTATAKNWGMALFVRTGPGDFNKMAASRMLKTGGKLHAYGGVTGRDGKEVACPEEEDVFRALGWPYAKPEDRDHLAQAWGRAS